MTRFFVTGGTGFIGSNLVAQLLQDGAEKVTVYDNFITGKRWHLDALKSDKLTIVEGDIHDRPRLSQAIAGHDVVFHLAANADIAKAAQEPLIDFDQGTVLTQFVLEAMRLNGIKRVLFTSGSGVYGEAPGFPIPENYPGMTPISTYGAQKLASEALVSSYCHMFDFVGTVTRFANVVGPLMTHGVTHDFIRKLMKDPTRLAIFGDGQQTKPYVHVTDVINAMLLAFRTQKEGYAVYNVASLDRVTVKDVADIVTAEMGLKNVKYEFSGGARGWRADVPVYELDSNKLRAQGWTHQYTSHQSVTAASRAMLKELAEKGEL